MISLKQTQFYYKDPETGEFISFNVAGERRTSEYLADINEMGSEFLSDIEIKGINTLKSIPEDYTAMDARVKEINFKAVKVTNIPDVKLPLDEVKEAIVTKGEEVKEEIEAKAVETLATIPDDYTTLANEVSTLSEEIDEILKPIEFELTLGKYIYYSLDIIGQTYTPYFNDNAGSKYSVNPIPINTNKVLLVLDNYDEINARAFGFCNSDKVVTSIYKPTTANFTNKNGRWYTVLEATSEYMFISIPSEYNMKVYAFDFHDIDLKNDVTTKINITKSCNLYGNGHKITVPKNDQSKNFALEISGNIVVNVYDTIIEGGYYSACRVTNGATVNFYNCEFINSASNGLSTTNRTNTNCFDCKAYGNASDGFNYHGSGTHTAYDCYGYDNGDDGISNHESCKLKINGGQYYGNVKAGIACPTYGATETEILSAYTHDNKYGIYALYGGVTDEKVFISGCLIADNEVAFLVDGYHIVGCSNALVNNTTEKQLSNNATLNLY